MSDPLRRICPQASRDVLGAAGGGDGGGEGETEADANAPAHLGWAQEVEAETCRRGPAQARQGAAPTQANAFVATSGARDLAGPASRMEFTIASVLLPHQPVLLPRARPVRLPPDPFLGPGEPPPPHRRGAGREGARTRDAGARRPD